MRTTLTIDPDVEVKLKRKLAKDKTTLKQVVNDALREHLNKPPAKLPKFVLKPHDFGPPLPGIDYTKLNQLSDQLEVEEFLRKFPHK